MDELTEAEAQFVEIISLGGTLKEAGGVLGVSDSLLCKWLKVPEKEELRKRYARAREDQADAYADRVIDTAQHPTLDPNDKRVRIDAYKWAAGKRKAKVYGDKVMNEHTGPGGQPLQVESKLQIINEIMLLIAHEPKKE